MNTSYPSQPGGITADERLRSESAGSGASGSGAGDATRHVADVAKDDTRHVADVAKGETRGVASEAKRQARQFAGRVQGEVRDQAATQQSRLAQGLQDTGSSFSKMADSPEASGYAPELVRAAGERVDAVGRWLDDRDPGSIVEEVKSFARRRPGVFLAIAAGAGIVVGRLTRALATPSDETSAGAPATTPGTASGSGVTPVTPPRRAQRPPTTTVGAAGPTGTGVGTGAAVGAGAGPDATGQGLAGLPPEPGVGDIR